MKELAPRALYISCTPPLPRDFGNRNRVYQTFDFLTSAGFVVDFLLYPFDYDWERQIPPYIDELKALADLFVIVPNTRSLHQPAAEEHHGIDEWWDISLEMHIRYLQVRRSYDLIFVNYVFFSKALDFFDGKCLKVLDTHDMMTGRKEVLAAHGVEPEFFYTTEAQESIGLRRADVVLAIKDSEAVDFRRMCEAQVVSLPFRAARVDVRRQTRCGGRALRIGFIGAENSVNVVNLRRFLKIFAPLERLYAPNLEIRIAGNVCKRLGEERFPWLKLVGRVRDVADFYADLDVIFVPLAFSTGQKIKVAEALAYGMPIVSTKNGFDGFAAHHPLHSLETIRDVALALIDLAFQPDALLRLAEASVAVDAEAERVVAQGFKALHATMRRRFERVVFVVDRPFWRRETLGDELWWQAAEYISHKAPVVVLAAIAGFEVIAGLPKGVQVVQRRQGEKRWGIPKMFASLCVMCSDPQKEEVRSLAASLETNLITLGVDTNKNEIEIGFQEGRRVSVEFPRFIPQNKPSSSVFDNGVASTSFANASGIIVLLSKSEEKLAASVYERSSHFIDHLFLEKRLDINTTEFLDIFVSPTLAVGRDIPLQNTARRICALRDLTYCQFETMPQDAELANALEMRTELIRSDNGWDELWAACSSKQTD